MLCFKKSYMAGESGYGYWWKNQLFLQYAWHESEISWYAGRLSGEVCLKVDACKNKDVVQLHEMLCAWRQVAFAGTQRYARWGEVWNIKYL